MALNRHRQSAALLLIAVVSAIGACARLSGQSPEPVASHAPLNGQRSGESQYLQDNVESADAAIEASQVEIDSDKRPISRLIQRHRTRPVLAGRPPAYYRSSPQSSIATLVTVLAVAGLVVLALIWRAAARNGGTVRTSAHDFVCLACAQCGRVLEVPRKRLARQMFCPRCGSTLPRRA
jgi:hypothetical protein